MCADCYTYNINMHTRQARILPPNMAYIDEFGITDEMKERNNMSVQTRKDAVNAQLDREVQMSVARTQALIAELERLENLPAEPELDADGAASIWFKLSFYEGSKIYTYSAVRTENKGWYTTGSRNNKIGSGSWDALITWITSKPYYSVWVATEYAGIAQSETE